ncbi:MAG: diguanylate cyclase [Acidobacteriota bacterium]|nr:diguanylate cyclase [Acidobacteriota bacterium]MDQ7088558.1 diguanylate cyclase [Acidobacteriota bacterium]
MRILIAEDDKVSRRMLGRALATMGHEVLAASDGLEAWHILRSEDPRLVIADWEMPNIDGLELVRRIRSSRENQDAPYVYVILLTSRTQKSDVVRGIDAGADDYITKPFDRDELMVRIRAGERVLALEEKLAAQNRMLETMAMVDGLTNIPNRRAFDDAFRTLCGHCQRFQHPYSVLMIDIDRFKNYNDTLGHKAGDETLQAVAQVIAESIRTSDSAFRYGGEEFVCLLPETNGEGAVLVAERLREMTEAARIHHPANPPTGVVTISVGVADFNPRFPRSGEEVLRAADTALYEAKEAGRNRVALSRVPAPLNS